MKHIKQMNDTKTISCFIYSSDHWFKSKQRLHNVLLMDILDEETSTMNIIRAKVIWAAQISRMVLPRGAGKMDEFTQQSCSVPKNISSLFFNQQW